MQAGASAEISRPQDGQATSGIFRRFGGAYAGGAAVVYPWQGCGEWGLMLCGSRTDGGEDGFLTVRPALDLPV